MKRLQRKHLSRLKKKTNAKCYLIVMILPEYNKEFRHQVNEHNKPVVGRTVTTPYCSTTLNNSSELPHRCRRLESKHWRAHTISCWELASLQQFPQDFIQIFTVANKTNNSTTVMSSGQRVAPGRLVWQGQYHFKLLINVDLQQQKLG